MFVLQIFQVHESQHLRFVDVLVGTKCQVKLTSSARWSLRIGMPTEQKVAYMAIKLTKAQ